MLKSDPIQDDNTWPSLFNSLRYIRALFQNSYYSRPPPDPPRFKVSSILKDSSSEPSSSRNSSPSISADSYATLYSSIFIKCDTTQCEQLWIVTDFPSCNPNKPTILIAARKNESTCVNRAITKILPALFVIIPTARSSISEPRPSVKKEDSSPEGKALRKDSNPWLQRNPIIIQNSNFDWNPHTSFRFL